MKNTTQSQTSAPATRKTDTTFFFKATSFDLPVEGLVVGHGDDEVCQMVNASEKLHAMNLLNAELFFRFPFDKTVGMQ